MLTTTTQKLPNSGIFRLVGPLALLFGAFGLWNAHPSFAATPKAAPPAARTKAAPPAARTAPKIDVKTAFRNPKPTAGYPNLRYDFSPKELLAICKQTIANANAELKVLIDKTKDIKRTSFANFVLPFEAILGRLGDPIGIFWMLKSTTSNKAFAAAGNRCLGGYFGFTAKLFTRVDLYQRFKAATRDFTKLNSVEKMLLKKYLKSFIRAGAGLPPQKRKLAAQISAKLAKLGMQFQTNLAQDDTHVLLDAKEIEGVPASVINTLKKNKAGKYKLRVRIASLYLAFLNNAKRADIRKKILIAYEDAQGAANIKLLQSILALRDQQAKLLGFPTFAHYILDERMAKTPKAVFQFLRQLRPKLRTKMDAELAQLLVLKRKENPKARKINAWDWRYYLNQLKKTKYAINDEEIRPYFPMNHVIQSVFEIYQTLLSVTFVERKPANAWHPDVRLFAILDNKTKKQVAHFYLDLFPRPGKYTHFAAFGFFGGHKRLNGTYRSPVSAVVGNWRRPSAGNDSLLSHDEVVTFFHEFGHIMHQTLTRAPFGSLAGTSVKRDFVEAPSQMLENWCWKPSILKRLSKHHKTGASLPDALIQKMIKAKHFNSGLFWSRQLFYAMVDMTLHTSGPKVDVPTTWRKVVRQIMPVAETQNTRPAAGFGHLIGYSAGYYGYLWSKVYAQDMFTLFEKQGLLSPAAGGRYRTWILEPGGTREPIELITNFLGRKPKPQAFYKELGIQ